MSSYSGPITSTVLRRVTNTSYPSSFDELESCVRDSLSKFGETPSNPGHSLTLMISCEESGFSLTEVRTATSIISEPLTKFESSTSPERFTLSSDQEKSSYLSSEMASWEDPPEGAPTVGKLLGLGGRLKSLLKPG